VNEKEGAKVSDRIGQSLVEQGVSATELAKRLGVSRSLVSHWVAGRRDPSAEVLRRIAEVLHVDSGWLGRDSLEAEEIEMESTPTAESGGTHPPDSLAGAVWTFRQAPPDGGRDYGNSNVFATPPDLDTLVRETGQNSLDAQTQFSPKVTLRYSIIELEKGTPEFEAFAEALGLPELLEHVRSASTTESKVGSRLASGLERLESSDRIQLVRIDDYGTTGLKGEETPVDGSSSPFAALIRNNLDSSKATSTAGGSFGLGKAVNWRCSSISTVAVASEIAPDDKPAGAGEGFRVIAKAELTWHRDSNGSEWAGPGWLARSGSNATSLWLQRDALTALQLDRTDLPDGVDPRHATGTSILIAAFQDPQGQDGSDAERVFSELARAAAVNFWPAIKQGRCSVVVERWLNRERVASEVVDPHDYVPEFCDAFDKYRRGEVVDELTEPGDVVALDIPLTVMATRPGAKGVKQFSRDLDSTCHLVVRLGASDAYADHVALVRGRLMVVKYLPKRNIVVGGRPFQAILLSGTAVSAEEVQVAAEQFLRAAEPPAHDEWSYNPELGSAYKQGTGSRLKEMFDAVTTALRRAIRPQEGGERTGPEELRRLLKAEGGSTPGSTSPATLQHVRAQIVDGAWSVRGQVFLKNREKRWKVTPRLWLDVESGQPVRLEWEQFGADEEEADTVDDSVLLVRARRTTVRFWGRSSRQAEGLPAAACRLKVDLRAEEVADAGDL
jgi:transcriptional regulator with XRE-family HTH domain